MGVSVAWITGFLLLLPVLLLHVQSVPIPEEDRISRCRGMPCEEYDKSQLKLREIQARYMNGKAGDDPNPEWQEEQALLKLNGTIDGCVMLTLEQMDWLLEQLDNEANQFIAEDVPEEVQPSKSRRRRSFLDKSNTKWDMPIHWKFDGKHDKAERAFITSAFQHWMDNTCVRFKQLADNEKHDGYHLLITNYDTGCTSFVGRVPFVPQVINLKDNCLWQFGIPVHEIGHSLGMYHMQQRFDRDAYLNINWGNLGQFQGQYLKLDFSKSLGVPYGYSSVMHYSPGVGSVNGKIVMETKDPLFQSSLGQRTGLSFLDTMLINKAYCADVCGRPLPRPCERSGYQDPNHCERCICPDGFAGDFCQYLAVSEDKCGDTVHVSASPYYIYTPKYDKKRKYRDHTECTWLIKAPPGERVILRFVEDFGVYCHYQGECFHWVEVQYKKDIGLPGPRFCCYDTPQVALRSEGEEMLVIFRSNWTAPWHTPRTGFKASLVSEPINDRFDGEQAARLTTPKTTPTPTLSSRKSTKPTTTKPEPWQWDCTFDDLPKMAATWSNIEQDRTPNDEFDWTITNGATPSYETGPDSAFQGEFYIYIEASNPRKMGDRATFRLPQFDRSGQHCLSFRYHMFGFHTNSLVVFLGPTSNVLWSRKGEQQQAWLLGRVAVDLKNNQRIGFTATRGAEFSGDIALDDIHLTSGSC